MTASIVVIIIQSYRLGATRSSKEESLNALVVGGSIVIPHPAAGL